MRTSSLRVRFALVGIFALLALGFLLSESSAQPGRPPGGFGGRLPGGVTGMPGRPPGGVTGMPARPPGGITGRPPGSITGTPGGPGFGGAGVGGAGGIGGSPSTSVWKCSRCGYVLGHGPVDPGQPSCASCGAHFSGASTTPGFGGGGAPSPFGRLPEAPPAPAPTYPVTVPTAPAGSPEPPVPEANPAATDDSGSHLSSLPAPGDGPRSGRNRTAVLIAIVVGGIVFFGALAALAVVVCKASASRPARLRRRRALDLDD